jgi:hypothetical protein
MLTNALSHEKMTPLNLLLNVSQRMKNSHYFNAKKRQNQKNDIVHYNRNL